MRGILSIAGILLLASTVYAKPAKQACLTEADVEHAVAAALAAYDPECPKVECPVCPAYAPEGLHLYKQNRRGEYRPTRTYLFPIPVSR